MGYFDDAGTRDLRALGCLAGVMDRCEVLVQSYREEGLHSGRAVFSRALLRRFAPSVCVSTEPFLRANAALAVWPYDELDIGRGDSSRAFVHLVGALSPRRSLVRPGRDEDLSPDRRHRALWAGAPSDLFGPNLCSPGNSAPKRNRLRAACRRRCNLGL